MEGSGERTRRKSPRDRSGAPRIRRETHPTRVRRARHGRTAADREPPPVWAKRSPASAERALQLGLRHLRPAPDVPVLRLFVELILRLTARTRPMTAGASPTPGRDVVACEPGRLPSLSAAGPFLVDRARSNLLRFVFRASAVDHGVLDVLVLTRALRPLLHPSWRHGVL